MSLRPADPQQVQEAIAWAAENRVPLAVQGAASKSALGRHAPCDEILDLSALSGVPFYEPEELVMTALVGTPLRVVEETLKASGQEMCFEPADYGPLLGRPAGLGTIGGVFACNISGPRRVKSGAARDYLLGAKAVNGRGEFFKCGSRVMKNVTGYDVCKLLAGSFGTLAAMTEVTFKVLPLPSEIHTVMILGLEDEQAVVAMTEALQSPYEVYGAVHLPKAAAARSSVESIRAAGKSITAVRIEGPNPSIRYCGGHLREMFHGRGALAGLDEPQSQIFWRELRDVTPFMRLRDRTIWRLSVTPSKGASVVREIEKQLDAEALYDWGGGLIWLAVEEHGSDRAMSDAGIIRRAVAHAGGHALLFRATPDLRARLPVFQPQSEGAAALSLRLKESFDPQHILNPGRMYEGL